MIEADKKETIIVGYAFLEDESEEERAALQRRLEKTFGTDHLLYLAGDKEFGNLFGGADISWREFP